MVRLRQSVDYDADVLVVGAGPAGAATAAHLARRGIDVLLLDRQHFPRDKVCGDFVGPAALVELQRLGITNLPEYEETNEINYAALHVDGKELIRQAIPDVPGLPRTGRVITRMSLDDMIFRAAKVAGARIRTGVKVTLVTPDDEGVYVEVQAGGKKERLRTKLVVGSDGSGSLVSRTLRGAPPTDYDRIIAIRAYYSGVQGDGDTCELYFAGESFPGYYWLFPTSATEANVGIGMILETLPPTEDHLKDLLGRLIESDPALRRRLRHATLEGKIVGWPLTTFNPGLPCVGRRMLLTGDAAGLINPLNGEGIQYALLSGRWAADTIEVCSQLDNYSDGILRQYEEKVSEEMRYDMALAGMIVQLIRNRRLNPVWLYALKVIVSRANRDDGYSRIVGGILAGIIPASDALSLHVIAGTASQAAATTAWTLVSQLSKGPDATLQSLLRAGEIAIETASDAIRHPASFCKWTLGVGASGVELASQAARHTMRKRRSSSKAMSAS